MILKRKGTNLTRRTIVFLKENGYKLSIVRTSQGINIISKGLNLPQDKAELIYRTWREKYVVNGDGLNGGPY